MLRTFIAIFLMATAAVGANAEYVGFRHGSEFVAAAVEGQVTVSCNGFNGSGSAIYSCRDVVLDPQAYDYFVGPRDPRAASVELRCIREDGSVRTKSSDYDGARGISTDSFNLWISTLFQKPLLQAGVNTIEYRIIANDRPKTEIAKGRVAVKVTRAAVRRCPNAHYQSTDINDCSSQYSVCQRYFEEYRNCK